MTDFRPGRACPMMEGPRALARGPAASGGVMAVSLGMRISGLLVVGAVAVAAAAFTGDGSDTPDRGYGGGTVSAGPSSSAPLSSTTVPVPSPDLEPLGPAATHGPRSSSPTPTGSSSPTPSATKQLLQVPQWLPSGPDSPNSDGKPDPSSVYDTLRKPSSCRSVLGSLPAGSADADWQLLRGLASACLAVQGRGGSWDTAAKDYTALAGRPDTCKGRAGYAVLGGLLDFHRRHPNATVRLEASSGDGSACAYGIAGVDSGGDGQARVGETVGVELTGVYFDPAELLGNGKVLMNGREPEGPLVLGSASGDRVVVNVVVPELEPGDGVDVVVRFGGVEVRAEDAFIVVSPEPVVSGTPDPSPVESYSVTPQGVFPLGPFAADHAGAETSAGLRVP